MNGRMYGFVPCDFGRELGVSFLCILTNNVFLVSVQFLTEPFRYFPDSPNFLQILFALAGAKQTSKSTGRHV